MVFCGKCGTRLEEGIRFCPNCGEAVNVSQAQQIQGDQQIQGAPPPPQGAQQSYSDPVYNNIKSTDIVENKLMAVLAYLGILVLIPIFAAKNSPYARFHANQGLVLLIAEVIVSVVVSVIQNVLYNISWGLGTTVGGILSLISVVFLVLSIIGIVNAVQGKMKELPILGSFEILK